MIMPKKNGREAYNEISHICPSIKVLFSSGYTADFIENRGVSEKGIDLIMKPVQPMDLLRKIRGMLDAT
jgi:polar amino acid transport system substrate-binding protein